MSSSTTVKLVYGLEETKAAMRGLRKNIRRNVLRRATRAGAVVIQKEARRRVPVRTGALRRAIAVRTDTKDFGVRGRIYISGSIKMRRSVTRPGRFVSAKKGGFAGTIYPRAYAHLVEFGTQPHRIGFGSERATRVRGERTGPAGRQTGRMHPGARAKPFMRPAYDIKKEEAARVFEKRLRIEVQKEIDKLKVKKRVPAGVGA